MPSHARNPSSDASDGGSESSLTDMLAPTDSWSCTQARAPLLPPQPRTPPPAAQPAQARNRSVISKTASETSLSSLSSLDSPQRTQPTQDRHASVVSRTGTESSLSSLTSTDSDGQQRPRTPNTGNTRDVPGLTLSPSTDASSPESTRSYGFTALEEYSALGNVVKRILDSKGEQEQVENLYARVQKLLTVFNNELYSALDTPEWVDRVCHKDGAPLFNTLTVRRLFKAMCNTAEGLQLVDGKRYVMAAVCACAIQANDAEENELDFARRVQKLASTWAAFLLWPFFAQKHNTVLSVDEISDNATPTRSETASLMDEGLKQHRQGMLREDVLKRDGYRCVLSGSLEAGVYKRMKTEADHHKLQIVLPAGVLRSEQLNFAHIFKRSVMVYSSNSSDAKDKDKFHSVSTTLKILRHYCQLDAKYLDDPDLMDRPENAMSLTQHFHTTFDSFSWCLKPTEDLHRYEVKEFDPFSTFMNTLSVPPYITFKDYTFEDANKAVTEAGPSKLDSMRESRGRKRPHEVMTVDLPDPELLRLHAALAGVLRMSGAAGVFELIIDRQGPGNPPVPSADGEAFMKEVMDPEVQALWESVEGLRLQSPHVS